MLTLLAAIPATLILVAVLIGIHELGHMWTARLLGIKVLRYSLGFGKQIYTYVSKKTGIEYAISALPIGGYVKMLDTREGEVAPNERSLAFDLAPSWKRFLVIIAGPLCNFLFAIVAWWLIFLIGYKSLVPVIPQVAKDSALAKAGVKAGYEIVAIDGHETLDWPDVTVQLFYNIGVDRDVKISYKKSNASDRVDSVLVNMSTLELDHFSPDPIKGIGIILPKKGMKDLPVRVQRYGPISAWKHSFHKLHMYSYFSVVTMKKLLMGNISLKALSGPLGIVAFAGMALLDGIVTFIMFMAIVSIMVGIVNLVPFPGLDGGHLLYLVYETFSGEALSTAVQVLLFRLGVIALSMLFIQVIMNDLVRLTS